VEVSCIDAPTALSCCGGGKIREWSALSLSCSRAEATNANRCGCGVVFRRSCRKEFDF
jgi:hypothetical protein